MLLLLSGYDNQINLAPFHHLLSNLQSFQDPFALEWLIITCTIATLVVNFITLLFSFAQRNIKKNTG